jgi:hypothetical protein
MKQLNKKLLRSLLIAAWAFCIPILTAKAQTGGGFFPPEKRWISTAQHDYSGNPMDSTISIWTQKGFPVNKEFYEWKKGQRQLSQTSVIVSETENDLIYETTTFPENENEEEVKIRVACNYNEFDELLRMETFTIIEGMPPMSVSVMTWQYWRGADNRLDSILLTAKVIFSAETKQKTIFSDYNEDGRAKLIEQYNLASGFYMKEEIDYIKNNFGKLERQEIESYSYDAKGELIYAMKDITYFDAKERPVREDHYSGTALGVDPNLTSYLIYYYDTSVGIANSGLPAQQVIVSATKDWLSVNSSKAETIAIYSLAGTQVYACLKTAGEIQISLGNLSQGIYLIKGSSGWVEKFKK